MPSGEYAEEFQAPGMPRETSVVLTDAGKRAAKQLTAARAALLRSVLDELSPAERETLHSLMSRMMASVIESKEGGAWFCRLCDSGACGRAAGHCPAAAAAAGKYAGSRRANAGR